MEGVDVLAVLVALVGFALVSRRLERWWISMPMVFVALGAVGDGTGIVDLTVALDEVALLAEVTLGVILFSDAVRMDVPALRRQASLPLRLLLIGLPLTIAIGAVITWSLLDLTFWAAALAATIVAPTDAALGEAVVSEPSVPPRIRQALNVESGLNDGMAVPAFVLFVELVHGTTRGGGEWAEFVTRQIGGGVAVGLLVGGGGAWLLARAIRSGWIEGLWSQLATVALALLTISLSVEIGVNAFIAAFVAGLAFGAVIAPDEAEHLDEYTADSGTLLAAIAFFVFGNLFVLDAFDSLGPAVVACALLALTLGRMVPVAVATLFLGLRPRTVAFVGWFGPRGLASIVFGIAVLEEELEVSHQLFDVVTLTVVASVVLHGLTAPPFAASYGQWYDRHRAAAHAMPESHPVAERRLGGRMTRR